MVRIVSQGREWRGLDVVLNPPKCEIYSNDDSRTSENPSGDITKLSGKKLETAGELITRNLNDFE